MRCFKFHKLSDEEQALALAKIEFYNVQGKLSIYGDGGGRYLMWEEGGGRMKYIGLHRSLGSVPLVTETSHHYFSVSYMPEDLLGKGMIPYMGLPA